MSEKVKYELEFIIRSNKSILFSRLSTPSGLAEWFAEGVRISDNIYTFTWEGADEEAEMVEMVKDEFIRFRWLEADSEEEYFEFRFNIDDLTQDLALIVTDFAEDYELEESKELWEKQIGKLKQILGS